MPNVLRRTSVGSDILYIYIYIYIFGGVAVPITTTKPIVLQNTEPLQSSCEKLWFPRHASRAFRLRPGIDLLLHRQRQ